MAEKNITFDFGENWLRYIHEYLGPEQITEARESLVQYLGPSLKGRTFLDIGSGSGLFSLVALEMGADRVVSFDINPRSIAATEELKKKAGAPAHWEVYSGSILDQTFINMLGDFDVVYSYGVLHHTGAMWDAIRNAAYLVKSGGLLYIALYNKATYWAFYEGRPGPSWFWQKEKYWYSRLPLFLQNFIDYVCMGALVLAYLASFQNPIAKIRGHKKFRGMSWRVDIKDWLGGYPYEYASADEVFHFVKPLGFTLEHLKILGGLMNTAYVFRRDV